MGAAAGLPTLLNGDNRIRGHRRRSPHRRQPPGHQPEHDERRNGSAAFHHARRASGACLSRADGGGDHLLYRGGGVRPPRARDARASAPSDGDHTGRRPFRRASSAGNVAIGRLRIEDGDRNLRSSTSIFYPRFFIGNTQYFSPLATLWNRVDGEYNSITPVTAALTGTHCRRYGPRLVSFLVLRYSCSFSCSQVAVGTSLAFSQRTK